MSELFPNIEKACRLIALDNGGINRDRSVQQQNAELYRFLFKYHRTNRLAAFDRWLGALSETELDTLCTGEQGEADAIAELGPPGVGEFLNDYFDKVC